MPELPITTTNINVTRIDAPFPEQWGAALRPLTEELKAIRELMTLVAAGLTEDKDASEEMVKLYSKEAFAERASMVEAVTNQSQQRPLNAQGEEKGVSRAGALVFEAPPGTPGYEKAQQEKREDEERSRSKPPESAYQESMKYLGSQSSLMPQHFGGRYTATDLLNLMAKSTAGLNQYRNGEYDENDELIPSSVEGTGLAKLTQRLSYGGKSLVPNLQAAMSLGKSYYRGAVSGSEGLGAYAGSLGYEPGNGALGLNSVSGPFGSNFRMPFINSAALSGLVSTGEAYSTALNIPGLSADQVLAMNQSLAERGWFPNQQGKNELFEGQAHLISKGGVFQQLGETPQVSEMLDRGMRNGTASMEEMVKTVEEIPDAAKAAHEGIGQMVTSMQELGEFSESQGGTKFAGEQQAVAMAQTTGLPVQATKGLLESPWATSEVFRQTGVPSWMQGTVPGGIKNSIATQSFWRLAQSVGQGPGRTYNVGGFKEYVSPLEEQAARIHMVNPSMSYEATLKMLREGRTGTEGRQKVSQEAQAWLKNSRQYMGQGDRARENELLTASNVGEENFGKLLHNMAQIKTAQGNRMFSQEDIKKIRTDEGQGYSGHGNQLAQEKYKELQKILSEKAGKDANAAGSPGKVVLELSPAARRLLQLPNKQSRIKLEAGAGENQTNNGHTGYSDNLTPAPADAERYYAEKEVYGG